MKHNFLNHIITLFVVALLVAGCQPKLDVPLSKPLHKQWEFKGKDTLKWQKATVPGNVFTDLLDNKNIPDPFILSNEKDVQWVSNKDWEYKTMASSGRIDHLDNTSWAVAFQLFESHRKRTFGHSE